MTSTPASAGEEGGRYQLLPFNYPTPRSGSMDTYGEESTYLDPWTRNQATVKYTGLPGSVSAPPRQPLDSQKKTLYQYLVMPSDTCGINCANFMESKESLDVSWEATLTSKLHYDAMECPDGNDISIVPIVFVAMTEKTTLLKHILSKYPDLARHEYLRIVGSMPLHWRILGELHAHGLDDEEYVRCLQQALCDSIQTNNYESVVEILESRQQFEEGHVKKSWLVSGDRVMTMLRAASYGAETICSPRSSKSERLEVLVYSFSRQFDDVKLIVHELLRAWNNDRVKDEEIETWGKIFLDHPEVSEIIRQTVTDALKDILAAEGLIALNLQKAYA